MLVFDAPKLYAELVSAKGVGMSEQSFDETLSNRAFLSMSVFLKENLLEEI